MQPYATPNFHSPHQNQNKGWKTNTAHTPAMHAAVPSRYKSANEQPESYTSNHITPKKERGEYDEGYRRKSPGLANTPTNNPPNSSVSVGWDQLQKFERELAQLRQQALTQQAAPQQQQTEPSHKRMVKLEQLCNDLSQEAQRLRDKDAGREKLLSDIRRHDRLREGERENLRKEAHQMRQRERERETEFENLKLQLQNQLKGDLYMLEQERLRLQSDHENDLHREKDVYGARLQQQLEEQRDVQQKTLRSKATEVEKRTQMRLNQEWKQLEKRWKESDREKEKEIEALKAKVKEKNLELKNVRHRLQDLVKSSDVQKRREIEVVQDSITNEKHIERLEAENAKLRADVSGVLRVSDRETDMLTDKVEQVRNQLVLERAEKEQSDRDLLREITVLKQNEQQLLQLESNTRYQLIAARQEAEDLKKKLTETEVESQGIAWRLQEKVQQAEQERLDTRQQLEETISKWRDEATAAKRDLDLEREEHTRVENEAASLNNQLKTQLEDALGQISMSNDAIVIKTSQMEEETHKLQSHYTQLLENERAECQRVRTHYTQMLENQLASSEEKHNSIVQELQLRHKAEMAEKLEELQQQPTTQPNSVEQSTSYISLQQRYDQQQEELRGLQAQLQLVMETNEQLKQQHSRPETPFDERQSWTSEPLITNVRTNLQAAFEKESSSANGSPVGSKPSSPTSAPRHRESTATADSSAVLNWDSEQLLGSKDVNTEVNELLLRINELEETHEKAKEDFKRRDQAGLLERHRLIEELTACKTVLNAVDDKRGEVNKLQDKVRMGQWELTELRAMVDAKDQEIVRLLERFGVNHPLTPTLSNSQPDTSPSQSASPSSEVSKSWSQQASEAIDRLHSYDRSPALRDSSSPVMTSTTTTTSSSSSGTSSSDSTGRTSSSTFSDARASGGGGTVPPGLIYEGGGMYSGTTTTTAATLGGGDHGRPISPPKYQVTTITVPRSMSTPNTNETTTLTNNNNPTLKHSMTSPNISQHPPINNNHQLPAPNQTLIYKYPSSTNMSSSPNNSNLTLMTTASVGNTLNSTSPNVHVSVGSVPIASNSNTNMMYTFSNPPQHQSSPTGLNPNVTSYEALEAGDYENNSVYANTASTVVSTDGYDIPSLHNNSYINAAQHHQQQHSYIPTQFVPYAGPQSHGTYAIDYNDQSAGGVPEQLHL